MLYIVVNAATKENDFALIQAAAGAAANLSRADDRALIALQGPEAASVLTGLMQVMKSANTAANTNSGMITAPMAPSG